MLSHDSSVRIGFSQVIEFMFQLLFIFFVGNADFFKSLVQSNCYKNCNNVSNLKYQQFLLIFNDFLSISLKKKTFLLTLNLFKNHLILLLKLFLDLNENNQSQIKVIDTIRKFVLVVITTKTFITDIIAILKTIKINSNFQTFGSVLI